jgi:hypothetical protein
VLPEVAAEMIGGAVRRTFIRWVLDVIETGTIRESGAGHCWIWKEVAGRDDNLLCVAALIANAVVVKTVMHHFDPEGDQCT